MDDEKTNPEAEAPIVLEQNQRFSHSTLWNMQRAFFARQGIEAWRQGTVPHYITCNPFIAAAYAKVVFGFLRDCRAATAASEEAGVARLDPTQPVYIIELGSGSGRFAFHFLKKFLGLFTRSVLKDVAVKYVMTDFAEPTLDFWRDHASLQPFFEQGWLDFARFDAEHDRELTLSHSGETLAPDSVRNPIVVVANYVFDSLPQDAFAVENGRLHESLITVTSPQPEPDLGAADLLKRIAIVYEHRPIDGDYFDDAAWNRILRDYRERLSDTVLLFPCAAIRCLERLARLSGGRLLLLSADKGYSREEDLLGWPEPDFAVHGSCFSMMVNYHAIGRYVLNRGGQVLHAAHRHNSLDVCGFVMGRPAGDTVETRQAFEEAIERSSPDDFFALQKAIERNCETLSLEEILAYLRLSGGDADVLRVCFPALLERVDSATQQGRQELYDAIRQVWDTYYPIGEKPDLAFCLGMLLYGMAYYPEALEFFEHSLRLCGPDASTVYNMGMCHYGLRQLEAALACVDRTLELDPAFGPARGMRIRIEAEIDRLGKHGGITSTHRATDGRENREADEQENGVTDGWEIDASPVGSLCSSESAVPVSAVQETRSG